MRTRVALIGVGGYGRVHLRHLLDFHTRGELELAAAVVLPTDASPALQIELAALDCHVFTSFTGLLQAAPALRLDLAIVPTPIHLHADMSVALLEAGLHVLVEKPLTASPADAARIADTANRARRHLAVGFQYLHAPEIRALRQHLQSGTIGPLTTITIHGAWPRSHAYYQRNGWAGRLKLEGQPVLDSPVNNAMSHFVMLALHLAAPADATVAVPRRVSAELYRAQRIESFDTAVIHLETEHGPRIEIYCTHSSEHITAPRLRLTGEAGTGEWVQDRYASLSSPGRFDWREDAHPESHTRECMLRDVLHFVRGEPAFVCQAESAAAHVKLVDVLHRFVPIQTLPENAVRQRSEGDEVYSFVPGLGEHLAEAAMRGCHLHAVGTTWAGSPTGFSI